MTETSQFVERVSSLATEMLESGLSKKDVARIMADGTNQVFDLINQKQHQDIDGESIHDAPDPSQETESMSAIHHHDTVEEPTMVSMRPTK